MKRNNVQNNRQIDTNADTHVRLLVDSGCKFYVFKG